MSPRDPVEDAVLSLPYSGMVCSGAPYVYCGATVNTIAAVLAGTLAFGAPVFAVSFAGALTCHG